MKRKREKRTIDLGGRKIGYLLITSFAAGKVRVSIRRGGEMTVTKPCFVPETAVSGFLRDKSGWIIEKIDYLSKIKTTPVSKSGRREYLKYKKAALDIVSGKIKKFNGLYNFSVKNLSVRNQRTRWGSCSKAGNLNFNFRVVYLPDYLIDYIVVHELCHLKELNHSKKFWDLVSLAIPEYRDLRKELKKYF
ncbi:MAG TPA: M48 family metallopeptidase [Candidatus Paceibacterota bacterium]|nr:M48 family metallopeptidase [Candidatus Pacearchaeota archaeon]HRZ50822.1 M48 family metallopeptidase [Candidatus Paceibacterota bacterium]HSA36543.1 M48 family metallopeptidase [Candidatus Paceibacterota bacterium]